MKRLNRGLALGADGTRLDPNGFVLVPGTYYLYFNLKLSSADGEYLLMFTRINDYRASRFQADLTQIGNEFDMPSNFVGSNGSEYFVFWNSNVSLVGSPMSVEGVFEFPNGVQIADVASFQPSLGVNVTWDGTNWWTSWHNA